MSDRGGLHSDLILGRRELSQRFCNSQSHILRAGELLATATRSKGVICHLKAGWACQFRDLPDGRRAVADIYLPGDVIGLDAIFQTRPLEEIMTLTSITIEAIETESILGELMGCRSVALYLVWLLAQRQRRADRHLAAVLCLDGRERLATMLLEFYTRLRRRRLITAPMYNLPLTQIQIGGYLGMNVVHVNRVLRSLRDERIANLEKHCVTILDLERLTKLAQSVAAVEPSPRIAERPLSEIPVSITSHAAE